MNIVLHTTPKACTLTCATAQSPDAALVDLVAQAFQSQGHSTSVRPQDAQHWVITLIPNRRDRFIDSSEIARLVASLTSHGHQVIVQA